MYIKTSLVQFDASFKFFNLTRVTAPLPCLVSYAQKNRWDAKLKTNVKISVQSFRLQLIKEK